MTFKTKFVNAALASVLSLSALFTVSAQAADIDLSPEQKDRPRSQKVAEAIALIPKDFKFTTPGKLTVASVPGNLPFAVYATDTKTPVGSEPDIAQLLADSFGLELQLVPVAWADWPLGLVSGRFDAVVHNVTVTEERKEKYDFSSYRNDLLGFYVAKDSKITSITKPEDVAGLKVIVGASTNQEQILLRWIDENKAKGLAATEVQYYDDPTVQDLALASGRADAYLGPNAIAAFKAARDAKSKLVGTLSGGYPLTAEIAAATKKDSGLAPAITAALNAQIKNGNYAKALARWNLTAEAITESRTNPPGLPKKK